MKFNKSVYLLLFAACLSGLASCSDDDDFTWSEPVPSDCMDVYFADSNPTTYDVMSDEIDNLSFTVEVAPEQCGGRHGSSHGLLAQRGLRVSLDDRVCRR